MSASLSPFGFTPARFVQTARPYKINAAYATKISKYQPVVLVTAGEINAAAAAADIVGVFAGVEYVDGTGKPVVATEWPTGGVSGATNITAWVWDDPDTEFVVQADGSIPQTSIGDQADITNITANGAGYSQCTLGSALKGAGVQGQFRIVDFDRSIDNTVGDAFTKVIVQHARHQYVANKVAI